MQTTALVIRQKIRDMTAGLSLSKDYCDKLDLIVKDLVEKSIERAKANKRNTLMSRDL